MTITEIKKQIDSLNVLLNVAQQSIEMHDRRSDKRAARREQFRYNLIHTEMDRLIHLAK